MKQLLKAAALSMCCLAASACEPKRIVTHLPTPAERLVCEAKGERPVIAPEYAIDWSKVSSVHQARNEHQRYVASVRSREGKVAAYILNVEGKLFTCWTNMQWRRDFEAALPKP